MQFTSWVEFTQYIDSLGLFNMKPGLDRIEEVLKKLKLYRPPFLVVQVIGTNGKGSTSTFLANIAQAHGVKCGLHMSPHFITPLERIKLYSPKPASKKTWDEFSSDDWILAANEVMANGGESLSYFELVTAMSLVLFRNAKCALAIMETGLGGRFDATTAIMPDYLVYTPIAMDHTAVLGPTLQDIARDKAGAMRFEAMCMSVHQQPEVEEELSIMANRTKSPLIFAPGRIALPEAIRNGEVELSLKGDYQLDNAAFALSAWRFFVDQVDNALEEINTNMPDKAYPGFKEKWQDLLPSEGDDRKEAETLGLKNAWLPGRMQFISKNKHSLQRDLADINDKAITLPATILDGGHNPHGISSLGATLAKKEIAPAAIIFSCLEDKNPELIIPHLRTLSTGPIFVPLIQDNPRAMDPKELASMIGLAATPCESLEEAIREAVLFMQDRLGDLNEFNSKNEFTNPLLICGSLYLLGEFYNLFPSTLLPE